MKTCGMAICNNTWFFTTVRGSSQNKSAKSVLTSGMSHLGTQTSPLKSQLLTAGEWVSSCVNAWWVLAVVVWHCVTGQGTSPVCSLSRSKSEWVPGSTVIACVLEYFPVLWWQQGLYVPLAFELVQELTVPQLGDNNCKSNYHSAVGCQLFSVPLFLHLDQYEHTITSDKP